MSAPDEFMREINAIQVPSSLLGEVMHLWASLSREEWSDFDRCLERVVEFIGCDEGAPMLAAAVALRLMALDVLVVDPEFRGWLVSERSHDGITYIHGDLLRIAAEQTVLEGPAGKPIFDRAEFRARLMELAEARGRA